MILTVICAFDRFIKSTRWRQAVDLHHNGSNKFMITQSTRWRACRLGRWYGKVNRFRSQKSKIYDELRCPSELVTERYQRTAFENVWQFTCYTMNSLTNWQTKWMNFISYIPLVKPEGHAQGYILRLSMVFNPLGDDLPISMWAILPLLVAYSSPSNHRWFFAASHSVPCMVYIAHVVTCMCGEVM